MRKFFIFVIAICVSQSNFSLCFAYDSSVMHPKIIDYAILQSNLDEYIKNTLNIPKGIKKEINRKQIKFVTRDGGETEDSPFERTGFHFHNPLRPWDKAGLLGGDSSVVWAQKHNQGSSGTYSWRTARDAYYQALTTNSEDAFELAFRSLGQVMHLIADASVPAHVRSDIHITYFGGDDYENAMTQWASVNGERPEYFFGYEVSQDIFDGAAAAPSAPLPISALWDRDIYDGTNPQETLDSGVGLAEYTNANFITEDTAFSHFPHPAASETNYKSIDWRNPEIHDAGDGVLDNKIYIYHNSGHRLATISYLTWIVLVKHHVFSGLLVDDLVLQDYASLLIPRAVGYSAAFLDYFFRGDVDMGFEKGDYYIYNEGHEHMNGTFSLYYDADDGSRYPVPGAEWFLDIQPESSSTPLSFSYPASPPPRAIGEYILVFTGQIGGEAEAVAGKYVNLCEELIYDPDNPDTVLSDRASILYVQGGLPPYEWEVSGIGFRLIHDVTDNRINTILADPEVCRNKSETISVTDYCGFTANGEIRRGNGFWQSTSRWTLTNATQFTSCSGGTEDPPAEMTKEVANEANKWIMYNPGVANIYWNQSNMDPDFGNRWLPKSGYSDAELILPPVPCDSPIGCAEWFGITDYGNGDWCLPVVRSMEIYTWTCWSPPDNSDRFK